jgi:hypothetical protein
MKAVTRHCDSDARDCRDGDNVYGVIRLLLHSAMTQQPRERSGLKSRENASLVSSRRRLTYRLVLLFLVNLLNFFDRTVPAVVLRPIRRNSCLNDTSPCPTTGRGQRPVLHRRGEPPPSQTLRHRGRAPRLRCRTHLPSDPLGGVLPMLDALQPDASGS